MNFHLTEGQSSYHTPDLNNAHHFRFDIAAPEGTIILHGNHAEFVNFASELSEAILDAQFTPCPDCISKN